MPGERANSILHKAIVARERECSSARRLAVVLAALGVLLLMADIWHDPTIYDALVILYVALVVGPVSYASIARYTPDSIQAIVDDPQLFGEARRAVSPYMRHGDTLQMRLYYASLVAYVPLLAALSGLFPFGDGIQIVVLALAPILLGSAVAAWWDPVIWARQGRAKLLSETGIDSYELMVSRGLRWSRWWGWVRSIGIDESSTGPITSLAVPPPHAHRETATCDESSEQERGQVREAIVAREQDISRSRRWSLAGGALAVVFVVGIPHAPLAYLFATAYLILIVAPLVGLVLHAFNTIVAREISEKPRLYVLIKTGPWWTHGAVVTAYGVFILYGAVTFLGLMGFGMVLQFFGEGSPEGAAGLLILILAIALPGLLGPEVWARWGRSGLLEKTGMDAEQVMRDEGYRWTWYGGWVFDESDSGSHRKLT